MRRRRQLTLPLVESWFDFQPPAPQSTARALHEIVMALEPDLDMAVRSGNLVYIVDGVHAMALAPHRTQMHLQIFEGAALVAAFPQLDGTAKGLRQLRMRHGQPFDDALVRRLVQTVLAATRVRAAGGGTSP